MDFGVPDYVETDHGPSINGEKFGQFLQSLGIKHRKITPCWQEANELLNVS